MANTNMQFEKLHPCPYTHRFFVVDFNIIGKRTNTAVTVLWLSVNASRSLQATTHGVALTSVSCAQCVDLTASASALTAAVDGRPRTSAIGSRQSSIDPDTRLQRSAGTVIIFS